MERHTQAHLHGEAYACPYLWVGIHRPISTGRHTQAPVYGEAYTGPYLWGGIHMPIIYACGGKHKPVSRGRRTQAHICGEAYTSPCLWGHIRAHIYVEACTGHIYRRRTQAHGKFCVVPCCRLTDLQSASVQNVQLFLCLFLSCQVFRASPRDSPRDSPRESPQDSPRDSP